MSRPENTNARIAWLSTWPHGLTPPIPGPCDNGHKGPFRQQPGRDGKIYRVCGACGSTIGAW